MKKFFFLITLLTLSIVLSGQDNTPVTQKDVLHFFETKTYVVLDDNPVSDFNFKIEEQVKKYWKVTPYEFIDQKTFHLKRTDPNNSFLVLSETVFIEDNLQARYDFFSLLMGGNYSIIKSMPVLGAIPIGYTGAAQESSMYKLGAILKFLQAHVYLLKNNPEILKNDNMFKYYNDSQKSLKDKTLYLIKEEQAPELDSKPEIGAIYPYKIQFVSRTELEQAIDNNAENVVFLHKVGPEGTKKKARCFKLILSTNQELYYFDWHMISDKKPDGLLESDYKKIVKFDN
ncbi:MAG: hypothetical protein IPO21_21555 [Bacteroidales bacterium]|nr:hypothetical protein [Bacteroidales bacterium]